jgi:mono/diheme cytochrome c family protein
MRAMFDLRFLRVATLMLTVAAACDKGGDEDGDDDGGGTDNARTDAVLALTGDAAAGMATFTSVCGISTCHGADGNTPGTADTKRLSDVIPTMSDRELCNVILNGQEAMPPQLGTSSDQDVANVVAYVLDTF